MIRFPLVRRPTSAPGAYNATRARCPLAGWNQLTVIFGDGRSVKNAANRPLTNDRMLSTSRLIADEDNLELLLNDNLVVDAG